MSELYRTHLLRAGPPIILVNGGRREQLYCLCKGRARRNPVKGVPVLTKAEQRNTDLVDRVKAILETRGLTLHNVSRRSAELYGRSSHYFLPHNFYYALRRGSFSPALHQFCALSRITDYDLMDWLRVFGFAPEKVPELQISLPSKRTILLDSSLDDRNSWVPWFRSVTGEPPPAGIVPLGQLVGFTSFRRPESLSRPDNRGFLYAKVGRQDALAFPELLPGSIVRINPQISDGLLQGEKGRTLKSVFLIEHSKGIWCCRVHISERGRIVPISDQLPYAHIEFQVPRDVRVLGIVDMEIRRTHAFAEPDVPEELANDWKPERIDRQDGALGSLLRRTRRQAALSFREASTMSRRLADLLRDERYFASPGSLSDYEVPDDLPRHFHKAITLCALYGIRFLDLIAAAGINMEEMGRNAIPVADLPATGLNEASSDFAAVKSADHDPDLTRLAQFKDLPFFLRGSLETLSGIKELSIRDFFWIGTQSRLFHPSLRGALLIIVNRHKKKPFRSVTLQQWQQPLYMLVRRDGTYFCASCSLDGGILVIHPNQPNSQQSERLRNHNDVEVIGEVVTIVRRIP